MKAPRDTVGPFAPGPPDEISESSPSRRDSPRGATAEWEPAWEELPRGFALGFRAWGLGSRVEGLGFSLGWQQHVERRQYNRREQ